MNADAWLDEVSVIVKTFERPRCVMRLIRSIRVNHPELRVLVCDDSREPLFGDGEEPFPGVVWLTLPFEAGHTLGAGRNYLIDRLDTPYFFLCDDDHVFTTGTRLQPMCRFLHACDYDIVGGAQGRREYGAAVFERRGAVVYQHFFRHRGQVAPGVVSCDRVSNTFMARTESVRRVRWEARVYANEHADFFLRARDEGLRVAQMGRTYVDHDRRCEQSSGWLAALFPAWVAHPDRRYRIARLGGGGSDRAARRHAKRLYQKFVLEKNGIEDIVDVYRWRDKRALERLIGKPADPSPIQDPHVPATAGARSRR